MAVDTHQAERARPAAVFAVAGWLIAFALVAMLALVWWIESSKPGFSDFGLPPPDKVAAALDQMLAQSELWRATFATLRPWIAAFAIASIAGIPLGVLAGRSRALGRLITPTLTVFGAFAVPALPLLIIVWNGLGSDAHVIATGALVALFAIAAIAAHGQRNTDAGAGPRAIFRALELGAVLALAGVLFAEFVGSNRGLGFMLMSAMTKLEVPQLFALVLYLWLLGLVLAVPFALARWISGLARA